MLDGCRILVTGGAGFIGSNLVHHLVGQGALVRVLDDFSTGRRENLDGAEAEVELIEGTIADLRTCSEAVAGIDFVLHQAALPSVPRSIRHPLASHAACATGTLNMLIAARDAGVKRFVYASSSSAYGNAATDVKSEDLPVLPMSPYAVAKVAGEQYARVFFSVYGLETVSLRYFNVFGPRQDPGSPYSAVVPLFIAHALGGTRATINGDGNQTRDFTHVRNAIHANLQACFADPDQVAGRVFNVGCGTQISVNRLWEEITSLVGVEIEAEHAPPRPGDVRRSLASLDASRARLGYDPQVPLADGLRDTVEWYSLQRAASET